MGYAFISYSTKNQAAADSLRDLLKKNRIDSWMAPYDIPVGSKYANVINKAIKECSCFILLLTNASQNSVWVSKEVERAICYKKPLFPIQLEDIVLNDEFEIYLCTDQVVAVQKIDGNNEQMKKILKSIIAHTGQPKPQKERKTPTTKAVEDSESSALADFAKLITQKEFPNEIIKQEVTEKGELLIKTLASFKVRATIRNVDVGSSLVRYHIVPEKGIPVIKITNLSNDLALACKASSFRIEAPIPGLSAIGIEIALTTREKVMLTNILKSEEFLSSEDVTSAIIGVDINNSPIIYSIERMPHLLIGGATGSGRTSLINSIMMSIICKSTPEEVRLILIDPKNTDYAQFEGAPHLLVPKITDTKLAIASLSWAVKEIERRYTLLEKYNTVRLDVYNRRILEENDGAKPLPKIVIIIDELIDLMLADGPTTESLILPITQKARAAGIYLILSANRFSPDILTGVIKANIPSRIAFRTATAMDTRAILDGSFGAEHLLWNGDMLFSSPGKGVQRIQGAYASSDDIKRIVSSLNPSGETNYDENILLEIVKEKDDLDANDEPEDGDLAYYIKNSKFKEAVTLGIDRGYITLSFLQRKLNIGYGKALLFVDFMQKLRIITKNNGSAQYEVIIGYEEWRRILKRYEEDV
ncbi:MAG: TIR domain-containing protein [Clostridia bacterium]|nr:TIR domain-containing protein [Clostridia bacterium]